MAMDGNGNFVVVWDSDAPAALTRNVFGQRFTATGVKQGSEFR